jgi:hypothetical protein
MLQLADRLLARTEAGALQWSQHSDNPGYFQSTVGEAIVSIVSIDADGNHPFVLTLWKTTGEVDESGNRVWKAIEKLSTADTVPGGKPGWERQLSRLWREARSDALDVEENIQAVLAQLGPESAET